eukprot:8366937-Lingulodinium_polyedra.AAC.1
MPPRDVVDCKLQQRSRARQNQTETPRSRQTMARVWYSRFALARANAGCRVATNTNSTGQMGR